MKFIKYPSLVNSYKEDVVEDAMNSGYTGQWVVTEKVDGANFSFYCDGTSVKAASRNQFVDESFYSCDDVIASHKDDILKTYDILQHYGFLAEDDYIIVTGELFGRGIQNRIPYNDKQWAAFSLAAVSPDSGSVTYLPLFRMFESLPIPVVPIISVVETLEEALSYSPVVKSAYCDADAEGIVISPIEYYGSSTTQFKHKAPAFVEITTRKKKAEVVGLTESDNIILDELLSLVTESRVYSALSKRGKVEMSDFWAVVSATRADVLEDYSITYGRSIDEADNQKLVNKHLTKDITTIVRPVMLSVCS